MSPVVKLLQRLALVAALFAIMTSGGEAHATDSPFGASGTGGQNVGTLHEVPATGALPYAVSFALPPNRGTAQPSLGLAYASGARDGEAGWGWSLTVPSIERAPLWGWPKYVDPANGNLAEEDRYTFDGAPLTFICVVGDCSLEDFAAAAGPMTGLTDLGENLTGYRYYRRQVEGGFERFFLNPTRTRWLIQRRGGEIWEMGSPKTRIDLQLSAPYDVDFPSGKIFRWNLAVQRDLHGDRNIVYYQWAATDPGERKFLRNIYYVPPAANHATAPLSAFAYHVELRWESPPYDQRHYTFADKRPPSRRLRRVAISAKTWANEGERELVRAYNLAYHDVRTVPAAVDQAPLWGRSSLKSVQVEGRCAEPIGESAGYLPDPTGCPTLPATTFQYQAAEINVGTATRIQIPNGAGTPGGVENTASATIIDVDRDGLPDIVSTWPTTFNDPGGPGLLPYRWDDTCVDGAYKIVVDDLEAPDPANPRLVCDGPSTTDRGSARRNDVWINGPGASFYHRCLDAGPQLSAANSVMWHQMSGPFGTVLAGNPALFTRFGHEHVGEWGNDVLLWSNANYSSFGIRPSEPGDFTGTDFERFCPEHVSFPVAFVWSKRNASTWARDMDPVGLPGVPHYRTIDIDGDGQPDLLRAHSDGQEYNGWAHAQVAFTRRLAANERFDGVRHGPALLPLRLHSEPNLPPFGEISSVSSHAYFQAEGDINGDGIPDVLTSMTGDGPAQVRLGDGRGGFGCDTIQDVACTEPGIGWLGPAYHLFFPDAEQPFPLQPDHPFHFAYAQASHRVHFLHDVTGDGYADLIGFTPPAHLEGGGFEPGRIQLWVNVDGRTFRCANGSDCVVGTISDPTAPAILLDPVKHSRHRIVITDFDANGTQDFVVIGENGIWTFPFLVSPATNLYARAPHPGLLTRIDNGLGALTEITYETIQELDRRAYLLETTFKRGWSRHVPAVLPVVTKITTRNTVTASGGVPVAPFGFWRTRLFEYHDPAYDVWERRFKGFAIVRAIDEHTREVEQRWFYFGPCERGAFIDPLCPDGSDGGYKDGSLQLINAEKALSGLLVRVDRFVPSPTGDTAAKWLSTTTTAYAHAAEWIRPSADLQGERDRAVALAYPARVDTYLYDTSTEVTLVESIGPPGTPQEAPGQPGSKRLRVDTEYDAEGNVSRIVRWGRVTGSTGEIPGDDKIETRILPATGRCEQNWACRPTGIEVEDRPLVEGTLQPPRALRRSSFHYNTSGDLEWVMGYLFTVGENAPNVLARPPAPFDRAPTPATAFAAAGGATAPLSIHLRTFDTDAFGNVWRVRGAEAPNRSCTTVAYDAEFAQFPSSVTSFAGSDCTGTDFVTDQLFDRGLAAPTVTMYPTGTMETVAYDPFGRAAKLYAPVASGGELATELAVEIEHYTQAPLPFVHVRRYTGVPEYHDSYEIMNSLGEHVLGFDQADPSVDGATSSWVARDWTARDAAGRPTDTYRPFFTSADPLLVVTTTTSAPSPVGNKLTTLYDDFGRASVHKDASLEVAKITHLPLEIHVQDAEQLDPGSPFAGNESSQQFDGHGRVVMAVEPGSDDDLLFSEATYLGTGEITEIKRYGAFTVRPSYRWVTWDSFGRMTENHEPNTGGEAAGWRYVYDAEGRLVGSSDARGCGKNLFYDALGRLKAEDYSPCLAPPSQPAYTPPDLVTGDGTEAFYRYDDYEPGQVEPSAEFDHRERLALGQLVSVRDRGAHTRLSYDDRGRVRRVARRVVKPGEPTAALSSRYDAHWFKQDSTFDIGDRLTKRTTGLDKPNLLAGGESFENIVYSARGVPKAIGSSYGTLVTEMRSTATGLPTYARYGDAANTELGHDYDNRERPTWMRALRAAAPAIWSTNTVDYPMPDQDTTQLQLAWLEFTHDLVGNPLSINDVSNAYWRDGAKPISRSYAYDRAYRVKEVNYTHPADPHVSPFHAERTAGDRRPIADRQGSDRVAQELFFYDAHGNVYWNDDDQHLTFDRSAGIIWNGFTSTQPIAGGPHQFLESVDGGGNTWTTAAYDQAGNLTMLTVHRATCDVAAPDCTHRFVYDWDEVGQLVRARRWDFPAGEAPAFDPEVAPTWDLSYGYSQSGRTLTTKVGALEGPRHTLDVFDSLRVSSAVFDDVPSEYLVGDYNEVGFLAGGMARVFYDREQVLPMAGPTPLHVYLSVGDPLGSTAFVIDKDSGEVVERTQHQAFGKVESDYRPTRWAANREELKFTGKEEDIEVGVTYFGARFYNAHIGRWMSADPLTIHALGGDPNPYAYVAGRVSSFIDPLGLEKSCGPNCTRADEVVIVGYPTATDLGAGSSAPSAAPVAAPSGGPEPGWSADVHHPIPARDPTTPTVTNVLRGTAHVPVPGGNGAYVVPNEVHRHTLNEVTGLLVDGSPGVRLWDLAGTKTSERWKALLSVKVASTRDPENVSKLSAAGGVLLAQMFMGSTGRSPPTKLLPFTASNLRYNLFRLLGKPNIPSHAHHIFPQAFRDAFAKIGLKAIDSPYFAAWWEKGAHLAAAGEYNAKWAEFLATKPTLAQTLEFGRNIARSYGLQVHF